MFLVVISDDRDPVWCIKARKLGWAQNMDGKMDRWKEKNQISKLNKHWNSGKITHHVWGFSLRVKSTWSFLIVGSLQDGKYFRDDDDNDDDDDDSDDDNDDDDDEDDVA